MNKKTRTTILRCIDFVLLANATIYLFGMMAFMIYLFYKGAVVSRADVMLPFEAFILLPLLVAYMVFSCCRKFRRL